jgi:hypothetical protein
MAVSMQQLQVVDLLFAPTSLGDDVIDFERIAIDDIQPTSSASAFLKFQKSGDAGRGCWMAA